MNRQQKEELVATLRDLFSRSNAAFLVRYQGLTVDGMQQLRSDIREKGGTLRVAKARLFKRAISDLEGFRELDAHLKDQVGFAFSFEDFPGVAKALHTFSKENDQLKLLVGCVEADFVDTAGIVRIASLPPKAELLARACGAIKGPLSGLVMVLHMQIMQLLLVLKQAAEQKK